MQTVTYSGFSLTQNFTGKTLDQVARQSRAALGMPENVEAHIGGVPQAPGLVVQESMRTIAFHDKPCEKQT